MKRTVIPDLINQKTESFSNNLDKVTTIGRWFYETINDSMCLCSINMGAELYIKFSNSNNLEILFDMVKDQTETAIVYSINGGEYTRVIISANKPLSLSEFKKGEENIVKLKVDDIPESNSLWNDYAGIIITSIRIDDNGIFHRYESFKDKVLFIGDSITAGISIRDGVQPHSGGASINYCAKFCQELNFDDLRCAFGYTGIINPGPLSIPNALGYWNKISNYHLDNSSEQLSYIFLNHGTNDFLHGSDIEEFKSGYVTLVNNLKDKYPDVPIICIIPFLGYYKEHILEAVNKLENIYICDSTPWNIEGLHPNESESIRAGSFLIQWFKNTFNKIY